MVRRDQDPDQGHFKYNENTESCKGKDETMTYNLEREIIINYNNGRCVRKLKQLPKGCHNSEYGK